MTPYERAFWQRAQRRAAGLTPELAAALLRAYQLLRAAVTIEEAIRILDTGDVDRLVRDLFANELLDRVFIPFRERLRYAIERQLRYAVADLPAAGRIDGALTVSFDWLNPKVLEAVRTLDTRIVTTLAHDVRETVRQAVETGLTAGTGRRAIARAIRDVIGLAPNQETAVANFERALRGEGRDPFDYELRDKRYDATIKRGPLTEAQIDSQTSAYRRKMLAHNAATNARTASLNAMKLGQRLAWVEAVEKGLVDGAALRKRWVGVMDSRERPEHVAMEGETVPYDEQYSNGQMDPGDDEYNCRCLSRFFVAA